MAGIQRPGAAGVVACCLASFAVSATLWAQAPADAQSQNPASPLSPLVVDLAAIPSDAALAVVIRPAELADVAAAKPMFGAIDEALVGFKLGLPVSEIESFKGVFISADLLNGPESICAFMVIRSRKRHDWKKAFSELMGETKEAENDGHKYYVAKGPLDDFGGFWIADERTVVVGTTSGIIRAMSTPDANDRPEWDEKWRQAVQAPLAGLMRMDFLQMFDPGRFAGDDEDNSQPASPVKAFIDAGDYTIIQSKPTDGGFAVHAELVCRSEEGATQVAGALNAGLTLLRLTVTPALAAESDDAFSRLAEQGGRMIAETKITAEGSSVRVEALANAELISAAAAAIRSTARSSAAREAGQKKLAAIATAMNKYHDDHGQYPSPVVLGPDGDTPHSWRVEILPYLEGGQALHDRYRMNEPWDSEHNRQVAADGRALFEAPTEPDSDEAIGCGYFVLTGKGALFGGEAKPTRDSVTDPAKSTILVVEARRPIVWTQPEDIPYDPDAPLPQLGGNPEGNYGLATVNGSVQFMSTSTDEATVRSMVTIAGGDNPEPAEDGTIVFEAAP